MVEVAVAGRDEYVAVAAGRTAGIKVLGASEVVEDQQPALLASLKPAQRVGGALFRCQIVNRQTEGQRERGEVSDAAVLGVHPHDDVVLRSMTLDVARGKLCLADAAKAGDRLRDDRRVRALQPLAERVQLDGAAGEVLDGMGAAEVDSASTSAPGRRPAIITRMKVAVGLPPSSAANPGLGLLA